MIFFRGDCRYFTGEKPCLPHKQEGVVCRDCPRYDPVRGRILIVKLDAAGDVLRSTAILPALRQKHPDFSIFWITEKASRPLLQNNPYIDTLLSVEPALPGLLSEVVFDTAYNFDMGRTAASILHMSKATVKKGFGLSKEGVVVPLGPESEKWFEMGIFDAVKRANQRTYQQHLFDMAGVPYSNERPQLRLTSEEKGWALDFSSRHKLSKFQKIVGFNLGAGGRWPTKRWAPEHFKVLAKRFKKKYPKVGLLLLGGPEERAVMSSLAKALKHSVIATGTENSLRQFSALVDLCDVLLTGDTLALHVGVALGKRVVAYFGPTSDTEIDLYDRGEKILAPVDCLCYYRAQCSQPVSCLDLLKEEAVLGALDRQLKQVKA